MRFTLSHPVMDAKTVELENRNGTMGDDDDANNNNKQITCRTVRSKTTTAQGEEREKQEEISPTSSDDDKLSAGREATRHEGNLLSKEVPSTPT